MPNRTPEHNAKIGAALRARGVGKSPTKVCPRCRQELPRSEFRVRPSGHTESYCTPCRRSYNAAKARRYRDAHPENRERERQANRKMTLKRFHGITPDEYDEMVARQHGVCAICGQGPGVRPHLVVDHYHETPDQGPFHQRPDLIRGLLCDSCNRGLGFFDDNAERLRSAAMYLDRWAHHPDRLQPDRHTPA